VLERRGEPVQSELREAVQRRRVRRVPVRLSSAIGQRTSSPIGPIAFASGVNQLEGDP